MRSLARSLVWLCLALAIFTALGGRFATAAMWWFELLRYAPYPVYVTPAVLAALLAVRLGWAERWAAAFTLALVFTEVMGLAWGRPDEGAAPLRFMTYNVKSYLAVEHRGGFEPLVHELATQDPDLLVMQDAITVVDALSEHPEFAAQERRAGIGALRDWLRGRSTYAAGQYVVSSRLPLRNCQAPALDAPGEAVRYAHCIVDSPSGPLDLFTVHFVSPREGLNAARRERLQGLSAWRANFAERLAQSRRLAEVVRAAAHPVILAGDLNAEDDSPVVRQLLAAGLRDAFASAGRGYGYTHGHSLHVAGRASGVSFLRIDHVLVGPTVGVRECHAGDKEASEHRPVVAELLLVRRQGS